MNKLFLRLTITFALVSLLSAATTPNLLSSLVSSTSTCPVTYTAYCSSAVPVINYVSTDPFTQSAANRVGSLSGNVLLYLKGTGLSTDITATSVLIGDTVCPVEPFYTSSLQIVCRVPASTTFGSKNITVTIAGRRATCDTSSVCYFTYDIAQTPIVYSYVPDSINPEANIAFGGIFKVQDPLYLELTLNNEYRCNMAPFSTQKYDANNLDYGRCAVGTVPSGYYQAKLAVLGKGSAIQVNTGYNQPDLTGTSYNLTVVPKITGLSKNNGTTAGQVLTIFGAGFSDIPSENQVYYLDTPCTVLASAYSFIQCHLLKPQVFNQSGLLPYHSGLRLRTFTIKDSLDALKASSDFINEGGVKTYLLAAETEFDRSENYSEALEGFFKPPVSGTYKFLLSAQGASQLYISTTPLSKSNLNLIAEVKTGTPFRDFFDPEEPSQTSAGIYLEKDQYYFIQAIHLGIGKEHLTVGVIVPNQERKFNSLRKVISIKTQANIVLQQNTFKILSTTSNIQFYVKRGTTTVTSSGFRFPGTIADVESNMAAIGMPIKVTSRTLYNANKVIVTTNAQAVEVRYTFLYQNTVVTAATKPLGFPAGFVDCTLDNTPTALIQGYFQVMLNTKTLTINFNETADSVRNMLLNVPGVGVPRVTRYGTCEQGCQWVIQFDSNPNGVPNPTLYSKIALTGGQSGANVKIETLQDSTSNDQLFAPIPVSMLFTPESAPQITVSSKGILGNCPGSQCNFYVKEALVPTIIDFLLQDNMLEISLTQGQELTQPQLVVFFADIQAEVLSYDPDTQRIIAQIPSNNIGAPLIVAGTHIPQVVIDYTEFMHVASTVQGITIQPNITSIEIDTQASSQNMLSFLIWGSNFGYCFENNYETTIYIGDVPCTLEGVSNEWAYCSTSVLIDEGLLVLTVNGLSTSYPVIVKKPPVPLEVVDQQTDFSIGTTDIVFSGSNFDDTTNVIFNNTLTGAVSTCDVCSYSDTTLQCSVANLPPGKYTVTSTSNNGGTGPLTTINGNLTVPFEVYSISPKYGSQLGGTVITIVGEKFSNIINDNQVSMGHMNYVCNVFEANQTVIKCTTVANTNNCDEPQPIHVLQRLEYLAECKGDCEFIFSNNYTPAITNVSKTEVLAGDNITLYGKNFSENTQIKIANVSTQVVSIKPNEIVVVVPQIPAARGIQITAYDTVMGNVDVAATLSLNHTLQVTDYSPKNGSSAGTYLTLTGRGFSNASTVTVGGKACAVVSANSTTLVCKNTGNQGAVIVKQGPYQVTAKTNFAVQTVLTPVITNVIGLPVLTTVSELTLTVKGSYLNISTSIKATLSGTVSYDADILNVTRDTLNVKFNAVTGGNYNLVVLVGPQIAKFNNASNTTVNIPVRVDSVATVASSFAGGLQLEVTGAGFTNNVNALSLNVEGSSCAIVSAAYDKVVCTLPPLVSQDTQSLYKLGQETILTGSPFSALASENSKDAFDNSTVTYFKANSAITDCYFGIDFGAELIAQISQIQFYPRDGLDWTAFAGAVFEASNDNTTYVNLATLGNSIYDGWNTINSPMTGQTAAGFKFLRFRRSSATSKCEIAEVKVKGTLLSAVQSTDSNIVKASAKLTVNGRSVIIPNAVEYRTDKTPVISSVSPTLGSSKGNTTLTLTGTNLAQTTEVKIDNLICDITSISNTQVICITRPLPPVYERRERIQGLLNVFVTGSGKAVSTGVSFMYAEKWSDRDTWGCGGFPKEYDSVHVMTGMNLLIDVSPPKLVAVIVEGALIFQDTDLTFVAEYILVRNGFLQIGTESQPIQSNINITLYGNKQNNQLPIFGNKVIGLYEGTVDIHGKPRTISANLATTASANQSVIQIRGTVDWKAGDRIAISSTSYDPTQTEERTIVSVNGNSITLDSPLTYTHLVRQTPAVDGQSYEINAEVVLLSRNILIQGDINSDSKNYGVHMLFYDPGTESTIVRISYTEITKAGQTGFLGRFPINFQHAGNQLRSYLLGNSIHHTYQRGIQLQGTSYLTVQKNVVFAAQGYGINLENGVERFNVFEDNIVLTGRLGLQYLSTQEGAMGFRISNPTNFFRRNKAIAHRRFGFWFDLKSSTGGAYSSKKVCPSGETLGAFDNNVASWNGEDGIRFDTYQPRTFPCRQTQYSDQVDSFANNKPIQAVFKNNVVIGNKEKGVEAVNVGTIVFDGLKAIENGIAGLDFYLGDESPINGTVVSNSVFIGSTFPEQTNASYRGIRVLRSEGLLIDTVVFVNYTATKPALEIDSYYAEVSLFDSGARTVFLRGLKFINTILRVKFSNSSTHIFRDLDGTLTGYTNGGAVVNNLPHLRGISGCVINTTTFDGLVCNSAYEIRRIVFYEVNPETNLGQPLKILRLNSSLNESTRPAADHTSFSYKYGRNPVKSYAIPFALGFSYKVFFNNGLDFVSLSYEISPHWIIDDAPLTFVFNYSSPREGYDVSRWGRLTGSAGVQNTTQLWDLYSVSGTRGKLLGDWYHDILSRRLYVIMAGGASTKVKSSGYSCRASCPTLGTGTGNTTKIVVYWSDYTIWPGQILPREGDIVLIPGNWILILDINPPALSTVEIRGELRFDDTRGENIFMAKKIWVRGRLVVGSSLTQRFGQKAQIILVGSRNETGLLVNSNIDIGTKALAVTGELLLFGQEVTERISLANTAVVGSRVLQLSGIPVGWEVGHLIALTTSQRGDPSYEVVEIESISDSIVTLKDNLQYHHYSGLYSQKVDGITFKQDFSTEVILLNRTITVKGTRQDKWGCRIVVTEEYQNKVTYTGRAELQAIAMEYCGQFTAQSALSFEYTTNTSTGFSNVNSSIIVDNLAWGVKFLRSQKVRFNNNIIIGGKQFGIFFYENNNQIQITNNRIISTGFAAGTVYGFLPGISSGLYLADTTTNTVLTIQNNVATGFEVGFIIRAPECGTTSPYSNNIAYSGTVGFLVLTISGKCADISGYTAYRTDFGIMSYFGAKEIMAKNLFLSDNRVSLNLNAVGKDDDKKTLTIRDSFFAAFAMLDCPECYENEGVCQNNTAIMLGVATQDGKAMPPRNYDKPWESIHSFATFNAEQVFTNNTYVNFRDDILPQCSQTYIFKTNSWAADYTPYISLRTSHLANVSQYNYAYFENAVAEDRCGNMTCTGLKNVLIKDMDGTFLGYKGSIIPDNFGVIDNATCSYVDAANGYYTCKNDNLAILGFESLDDDRLTRIISPVLISNNNSFYSIVNAFKSHDFTDTLYTRLARFASIIQKNASYTLEFAGTLPVNLRFGVEGAQATDYSILKVMYYEPKIVSIYNAKTNEFIHPIASEFLNTTVIKASDPCGTNYFDRVEKTINFKITADSNCKLLIKKTNVLAVNVRYDMTESDFFDQGGAARFIDKIASILSIEHSRIRVISVKKGSVILDVEVLAETHDEATVGQARTELNNFGSSLLEATENGDMNVYGAPILDYSYRTILAYDVAAAQDEPSIIEQHGVAIFSGTALFIVGGVLIGVFCAYKYRKRRINANKMRKVAPETMKPATSKKGFTMVAPDSARASSLSTPRDDLFADTNRDSSQITIRKMGSQDAILTKNQLSLADIEDKSIQVKEFKPQVAGMPTNLTIEDINRVGSSTERRRRPERPVTADKVDKLTESSGFDMEDQA